MDKYNVLETHNYNLDYDLHVLNPANPDTTDSQRADCIHDALERLDIFVKKQVLANRTLVKENQELWREIINLRSQLYNGR